MSQRSLIIAMIVSHLLLFIGALSMTAGQGPHDELTRDKQAVRDTLLVDGNDPSCNDGTGSPAYCTIQPAVDAAGNGDTIQVATGTYSENVVIDGANLTIAGADASTTTVDGGGADRVFRVVNSSIVTLTRLGITNGNFSLGAGVYVIGSEARIERSLIYGNGADAGAGLFAFDGDVTVQNCAIFDNSATGDGGGIAVEGEGSLAVTASAVTSNEANRGGGIYALDVGLDLTDSEVMSNTAFTSGGGIFSNRGYLGVFNSVIQGNSATEGRGGGIATDDDETAGTFVEIFDSRILSNTSDSHGGGIYVGVGQSKSLSLQNSDVMYNITQSDGGGLNVEEGLAIVSGSVIQNNMAADDGGAGYIYSAEGSATVQNSIVRGNQAGDDGGGFFAGASSENDLDVSRSLLSDNRAGGEGGALFGDRFNLTRSTVTSNTARYGGAVYVEESLSGFNSTVSGNLAQEHGGGIFNLGYLDLNAMTIVSNTAGAGGGLDFDSTASGDVQKTLLANNVATTDDGPDCRVDSNASVTSLGYNVVGIGNGCAGTFLDGQNGDQVGSFGDPLLSRILPLADNGGHTLPDGGAVPTHALRRDSPAVDVIPFPTFCAADQTDQRGFPRTGQDGNGDGGADGDGCDVGAFEREGHFIIFLPLSRR